MKNERKEALRIITDVMEKGEYLPHGRGAYISRVTKGVVERAIELDYRINKISKTKIKRMHPVVRNILRLGAYEILYMDTIPESASVNEMVKLTRSSGQPKASGLVNALLRRIKTTSDDTSPQIRYSAPEWIYDLFKERFGEDATEKIIRSFLEEKRLTLRINASKINPSDWKRYANDSGINTEEIGENIYAISGFESIEKIPGFGNGEWYIQNPSSTLPVALSGMSEGMSVLDVCAAPGGKSIHAADMVGDKGTVEARDISEKKVSLIEENIKASGFKNIRTRVWDASKTDKGAIGKYDVVLADVPCSGLGVLAAKPEIKYRLKETDIADLAKIQRSILDTVEEYVKEGGKLVYSTCTITAEENDNQINDFLKAHDNFIKEEEKQILPDGLWDGFYICVMKKVSTKND